MKVIYEDKMPLNRVIDEQQIRERLDIKKNTSSMKYSYSKPSYSAHII